MNRFTARARIREVVQLDSELSESVVEDIAFHLTDWLDDLSGLCRFMENPHAFGDEEAQKLLMQFLIHVPNHLAAASKLWLDIPVSDIFDVGALTESDESS